MLTAAEKLQIRVCRIGKPLNLFLISLSMFALMFKLCSKITKDFFLLQGKEKTNREDLKTDIQHRKETFYRVSK